MGSSPDILCRRSREQDETYPHFVFHCKLPKTTLDFIRRLIILNFTFNISFKVSPEAKVIINRGFIFQFHDEVHSRILPTLLETFLVIL